MLFFVVFCINTQNPFDPNNPDYMLPTMTFEDFPVKEGDTVAVDSLCFVVRGNYKENYFRWWKESPDSADTNWTEWSGNYRWNDTMILTKLRVGRYCLHIQTAYHWNGDITDTSVSFYKVNTPRITNQSDTLVKSAVAVPCTLWVKASGTPPLAYQWYKDTVKIDGKISDTLFFPFLTISDTGRYRCVVSNKWGGDTSGAVRLVVTPGYRILYDGNSATGGSVPIDSNYYKEGVTVAVMGNTGDLAKTGYSFTGWNTASDGSGISYAPGDAITIGSIDVTLFAKWAKKIDTTYTVTFNSMGGTTVSPQTVKHGDTATKPPAPTKTDHVFAGWFKDSLCKTEWVFSSEPVTGNVTLYAKWIPKGTNQYTVTFNSQGGSAVPPQVVNAGQKVTKPSAQTKAGNVFAGWFRDSLYKTEWNFASDTVAGDLTLFAKWIPDIIKQYTVTFNTQGGLPEPPQQTVKHGTTATKPAPDPAKSGYDFIGWFKDSLGTNGWSFSNDTVTGNLTLYAKWLLKVANTFTVIFNSQGGSTVQPQTVDSGAHAIEPPAPAKTGHEFAGWFKDSLCLYAWNFSGDKVTGAVTLYAKWVPVMQFVAPKIDSQPSSATKTIGQSVSFYVVINSDVYPAPSYQWKHNGIDIVNAKANFYTIGSISLLDSGSYSVTITNIAGTVTSQTAYLTINYAPSITIQPQSQTLFLGQSVTFSAVATGNPTPDFVWKKNGVIIDGAIKSSYTIPAPGTNDSGKYTLTVSNALGSVTSDTARLYARFKSVAAGGSHTMVIKTDGTLWVFGDNSFGQLGDSTKANSITPKHIMDSVESVSAGGYHSLILKENKTLLACGWNGNGQLGDGSGIDRCTPVQVMNGVAVQSISAGNMHSIALTANGSVYTCGQNGNGQLGNSTTVDKYAFMPINRIMNAKNISAGHYHSLFIAINGSLLTCGSNSNGQLGDSTDIDKNVPAQIMPGVMVQNISAGEYHTLFVTNDGKFFGCGANSSGQIGNEFSFKDSVPQQIATGVQGIAAGKSHSLVLFLNGSLSACGSNSNGQLCDGTETNQYSLKHIMTGVQSVAAGNYHSLILTTDGRLFACGFNGYGQLGDGTTISRSSPVEIKF